MDWAVFEHATHRGTCSVRAAGSADASAESARVLSRAGFGDRVAPSVSLVFITLAFVTFIGFLAGRLFERTRFPDAPILLVLGLVAGPLNRIAVSHGGGFAGLAQALDPDHLRTAAPIIAALALVVLMFDSGMELDFQAFRRSLGSAAVLTMPIFILTVLGVTLVGHFLLGMPPLVACALGLALVNVDQAVSSGVLRNLRMSDELRAVYFVEMALYDLLSIPILISLLQIAQGAGSGADPQALFTRFATMASVSLLVGFAAGVPWMYALYGLHGHPNSYMLTFASALGVYGISELLGGSGAFSILIFGLLVGNRVYLLRRFGGMRKAGLEHEKVQAFHGEIAFVVRTLFFLYLGAIFWVGGDVHWPGNVLGLGTSPWILLPASLVLLGAIVLARYASVRVMAAGRTERRLLFPVFGRGLDTAVLATLPFLSASYVAGTAYFGLFSPWEDLFLDLALILILWTVLVSGVLVFRMERRQRATRASP